jgi:hypothetical protein
MTKNIAGKSSITFPTRKIKIVHADIEVDVIVTDMEHDRMLSVFNEQEMNPMIKLTIISSSGSKAEFTNLNLIT